MDAMDRPPLQRKEKRRGKKKEGKDFKFRFKTALRKEKRQNEVQEIENLEARIEAGKPESGINPLAFELLSEDDLPFAPYVGAKLFDELPLSEKTKAGLKASSFIKMTEIQRASLPHSLCGRDILGAAKTGSGKTLAFLIPVLEKLFRLRWGSMDGVGAIIISPTRELSVQIFEVLKKIGRHHTFSAGLLIGGRKEVDVEKECVNSLNIIVCTPGRLLQHMDETPLFDCSQLQVLVLDEADRILDMGFSKEVNAIVSQLPKKRQTLLFSATQTRSVKDLARLSLKAPEYLSVHAESTVATPARLQQTAIVVELDQKINMLWSFIKSHLNSKILIFLSSCKQVRFIYESFKSLHPGIPVRCLHGRMKQAQRLSVMFRYTQEEHSALFATDVASRGLDFPSIDWVVQVDCPEDVASYIHRVGRTARFNAGGRSVTFLMPSEMKMLALLQEAKVPIKVIKANEKKLQSVSGLLAALLSKNPDLKSMAQRAFTTYLRSIHLRKDKEIFDVSKLPIEEFSVSMGLSTAPRIRFLRKNVSKGSTINHLPGEKNQGVQKEQPVNEDKKEILKSIKKSFHGSAEVTFPDRDEGNDAFLTKKRTIEDVDGEAASLATRVLKRKKLKINVNKPVGQRFVFNEEGEALPPLAVFASSQGESNQEQTIEERYKQLREEMKQRDKEDKLLLKRRLQERKFKEKEKLKKHLKKTEDDYESDVPLSESDGDAENRPKKVNKIYFTSQSSSDSDDEGAQLDNPIRQNSESNKSQRGPLSIAEQEELALKLLSSRQ